MFKIGILGSDNSHAGRFAGICNLPSPEGRYLIPDARVVAIYGNDDDPSHTKEVAESCKIEKIVESPAEMMGMVDAVMVVYRDGGQHIRDILPFIKAGYPCWIDKPIAFTSADVNLLLEAMRESGNNLVCGGSTLKLNYDVRTLKTKIDAGEFGEIQSGVVTYRSNFEADHNGIFFYGSHPCEACMKLFGYDPVSVNVTAVSPENATVAVKYADKIITLVLNNKTPDEYFIMANGTKGCICKTMEDHFQTLVTLGITEFVEMLRGRECPISPEHLVMPVYMLQAIERSYKEKREVTIEEVK